MALTTLASKGKDAWRSLVNNQNSNNTYLETLIGSTASGMDYKASVLVASTGNITLSGTRTVDGVSVSVNGSRVLAKDQTDKKENGVYVKATGVWTRATDFDTDAEVTTGATVWVEKGTANNGTRWTLSTEGTIVVGTTEIDFVKTFELADAVSANTPSTIVARDASGDFAAGTITANLTGNASGSSGSCTGNSATATTAAACTGDVTKTGSTLVCTGGAAASGSSVGTALDTPESYSTGDKIASFKMGTVEKSYIDHAGAFHGNVTGNVTGDASGSSGSCSGNAATATTAAACTGDVTKTGATLVCTGGAAASGSSVGTALDTPESYSTGDKIASFKMGTVEKSYIDHAGAFHGNVTGDVTGNTSGSSGSCTGNSATASEATQIATGSIFKSAEVTGDGNPQNTAHGLGATPRLVWAVFTEIGTDGADIAEGTHDGTNCIFTVTNGAKYKVYAIK